MSSAMCKHASSFIFVWDVSRFFFSSGRRLPVASGLSFCVVETC